jgi:hypothetical protein
MAQQKLKILVAQIDTTELDYPEEFDLNATNVDFDNTSNGFTSDNVQEALEEVGSTASPGFSFGRAGLVTAGAWLRRPGGTPSNRTGVYVSINNPILTEINVSNTVIDTYTVGIYEHDGNLVNSTQLATATVTAATGGSTTVSVSMTQGKQLAVKLESGNVFDIGVDIQIKGSS